MHAHCMDNVGSKAERHDVSPVILSIQSCTHQILAWETRSEGVKGVKKLLDTTLGSSNIYASSPAFSTGDVEPQIQPTSHHTADIANPDFHHSSPWSFALQVPHTLEVLLGSPAVMSAHMFWPDRCSIGYLQVVIMRRQPSTLASRPCL